MENLIKAFGALYGFVAKGKLNALVTVMILAAIVGLALGSAYLGRQALTGGGEAPFYKQEPSMKVVNPPVSLEDGAVDVISVICATNAIPEVNYIVEWQRATDGRIEDAIFGQIIKAPLDSDCTPAPVEIDIPRGIRPGTWYIRLTVDTGPEQRIHNSQPFEVIP